MRRSGSMSTQPFITKLICVLLFQATIIDACVPGIGSGAIIGNPTFTFDVSPPVAWTYLTTGTACASHDTSQTFTTSTDATAKAKEDINQAITTPYTLAVTIEDTNICAIPSTVALTTANTGVNAGGAITVWGGASTPVVAQIYSKTVTVTVTTTVRLATSQWEMFANSLLVALAANNNVVPRSSVTVTGTS